MVSLASLDLAEMGRCVGAALGAGGAAAGGVFASEWILRRPSLAAHLAMHSRWMSLSLLALGALLWFVVAYVLLERTGSALPRMARKRLGLAA